MTSARLHGTMQLPIRPNVRHAWAVLTLAVIVATTSCASSSTEPTSDTIGLGDGIGVLESAGGTIPGGGAAATSPLGVASSCLARIDGDLRQQLVSPGSVASVRTDHWLSFEQFVASAPADTTDGAAPLDGWLAMSCTLPNGDTVSARTIDSTPADRVPLAPATHAVAAGLPDRISDDPDPSGVATWTVAVTLDGALFVPLEGGQAIVTTFDRDEVVVTVTALLTEVEPAGDPRTIALDASFRATCGVPYEGCAT